MADRIAIKRLSASDCTLFEAVFRKIGAGNQKSINLNADVLISSLYPNLAAIAASTGNEVAVSITIYGPSGKGAHKVTRKIIKNATYKNWRLNGEFILGPWDDPTRYDAIGEHDLAIMNFKGIDAPSAMDIILVSRSDTSDAALYSSLAALFGNKSMIVIDAEKLSIAAAAVPVTHPVYIIAADADADNALEDAALGGFEGAAKLRTSKSHRKITPEALANAKATAEAIGRAGEGLINGHLASLVSSSQLVGFTWVSSQNAVAPYDFSIVDHNNTTTFVDVKSTAGPFNNVVHLSLGEMICASGATPYRIYRVFELTENDGKLRVSTPINDIATGLMAIQESYMPIGVRVDGFSLAVTTMEWGETRVIERYDDELN